ncbi:hypothetical protein COO60DRAFT_1107260 [Scenedesmus sp. NREL 46B-D3]|nr:hypothetical protein COO60DRAFT_1107260 [Scenedesmus sp. NREL 46B-D3]
MHHACRYLPSSAVKQPSPQAAPTWLWGTTCVHAVLLPITWQSKQDTVTPGQEIEASVRLPCASVAGRTRLPACSTHVDVYDTMHATHVAAQRWGCATSTHTTLVRCSVHVPKLTKPRSQGVRVLGRTWQQHARQAQSSFQAADCCCSYYLLTSASTDVRVEAPSKRLEHCWINLQCSATQNTTVQLNATQHGTPLETEALPK